MSEARVKAQEEVDAYRANMEALFQEKKASVDIFLFVVEIRVLVLDHRKK